MRPRTHSPIVGVVGCGAFDCLGDAIKHFLTSRHRGIDGKQQTISEFVLYSGWRPVNRTWIFIADLTGHFHVRVALLVAHTASNRATRHHVHMVCLAGPFPCPYVAMFFIDARLVIDV